jgi:hypothetical protein
MGYLKQGNVIKYFFSADKKTLIKAMFWFYLGRLIPSKRIKKKIAQYVDSFVKVS